MSATKQPKLKPCPFCGNEQFSQTNQIQLIAVMPEEKNESAFVYCVCGARMYYPTSEQAIEAWNRREK